MTENKVVAITDDKGSTTHNERDRYFQVSGGGTGYTVIGKAWMTIEMIWASEKCWFIPGSTVTITDDQGNSKTFIKE